MNEFGVEGTIKLMINKFLLPRIKQHVFDIEFMTA